jgi:glutamyl-Q tRNA(Asp) synthetase
MTDSNSYRGRFAPSPSGPLHFGSLVAAMASYLHAKHQQGIWLLRIEDVDETRTRPGAANEIQHTLASMGFEWDEQIIYQSQRKERYAAILKVLMDQGHAYPCACSRADIASTGRRGSLGWIYPGSCREGIPGSKITRAVRLRTHDQPIRFHDLIVGNQCQRIESEVGDFIIRRADGYTAYQLAVVVDDGDQGITHVVRGADLLSSTARQIYLQQLLGLPCPQYAHTPLVLDEQGRKLSKQDQAHPVSTDEPLTSLRSAYQFLYKTAVEPDLGSITEFWQWAIDQLPGNKP